MAYGEGEFWRGLEAEKATAVETVRAGAAQAARLEVRQQTQRAIGGAALLFILLRR